MEIDVNAVADELTQAYADRRALTAPPSAQDAAFGLDEAYAVAAELMRRRRAAGHRTVGRKVGYANKALWRVFKLETLVWGPMYDDTVRDGMRNAALSLGRMCSPRLEPEIVFKLREPVVPGSADPADALRSVEWVALGFEIVDSVFADWKFGPADFVAAFGLHAALVVGEPLRFDPDAAAALAAQLAKLKVELCRNGEVVAEGSGRNSLRSPALCLGELATAIANRPGEEPLAAGELVSTGTLTEPQPLVPEETWSASVTGIDLADITLNATA